MQIKSYYLVATGIILLAMIPWFISYEKKNKDARSLIIIAVMSALAVASRVAFIATPSVKPVIAIIMIAGYAFGPIEGFLCGSITALVSNFFFSQGPWTPWQMFAWGLGGLVAGLFYKVGEKRILSAILGFVTTMLIVGPVLDTSSVFMMLSKLTWKSVLGIYLAGVPVNLTLAISTAVTLFLLSGPMLRKLNRVKIKYNFKESKS